MSFASRVTYTGDGVTKSFSVPFPYISKAHVRVYVNQALQLNPMHYTFSGPSTVLFATAPGDNDAIELVRWTSPSDPLVDFVDGSVLRAGDLDTAYLHNFYLSQEYTDSYNNAINNILIDMATDRGIVEIETDLIINALVQEMLGEAAAATLQQRVTDIDSNAEAILSLGEGLQTQINTLAQGIAATVFVQSGEPIPGVDGVPDPIPEGARWYDTDDNNAPYIYQNSEWININDPRIGVSAANITVLNAQVEQVVSAIVEEQFVRSNETETLGQRLSLIGSENGDRQAFIIDLDTTKVSNTESLAERFTALSAADATNAADILSESIARADGDGVIAADVTALTVRVGDAEGTITTHATAIGTLEDETANIQLEYGVDLTNNGYVSGFRLINGGTPQENAFVILANKFAIVATDGPGQTEYTPMQIVGGKVQFTANVEIDGDLVVSGTINGADALSTLVGARLGSTHIGTNAIDTDQINAGAVTATEIETGSITATHIGVNTIAALGITTGTLTVDGTLTMNSSGKMKSTGAGFESGAGFFLGYDTNAYKFYVGNVGTGNYMSWDGTDLTVSGIINVGEYIASDDVIVSANTERVTTGEWTGSVVWDTKKTFTTDKDGTFRLKFEIKKSTGQTTTPYQNAQCRITKNGSLVAYHTISSTSYVAQSRDIAVSEGDVIDIDLAKGTYWNTGAGEPFTIDAYVRNAKFCGTVSFTGNPTVDLN